MTHIHTPGHFPPPSSSTMHPSPLVRRPSASLSTRPHHSSPQPTQGLPPIVPFTSPLAPTLAHQLDTIVIFIDIPTLGGDPPQPWLASKDCTLAQLAAQVAAEYGANAWDMRLFYNGYRYGWSEEVKVGRVKGGGLGMKERDVVYVLIGGR
ncbi:hypothetical protein BCR44DRAFT_1443586 [Catenaria anguillulae PL171]|uniref:Ubiquitin-like domain-containing protein n=1 Tax=Catenaria anguillulae PL171 TaxID=765915 RepID=A0A1Y2HAM3_9FUNG|nr:hypothetical protein BCR44DRAFT_1443586 [Catenaria anguillulae PL171]